MYHMQKSRYVPQPSITHPDVGYKPDGFREPTTLAVNAYAWVARRVSGIDFDSVLSSPQGDGVVGG